MIIDASNAAAIEAAGYDFVIRYYWDLPNSSASGAGILTNSERTTLESNNLKIVAVWENSGNSLTNGTNDAISAIDHATNASQEGGSAIYFAVDQNVDVAAAIEYFSQIKVVFQSSHNTHHYTIGVYGSGSVDSAVIQAGLASYSWLNGASWSWSGTSTYSTWNIDQIAVTDSTNHSNLDPTSKITVPGASIGGVDVDVANVASGNFGALGSTADVVTINTLADLQNINNNLSGHYVLGANIDASATATWNNGAGFVPLGNMDQSFSGQFDGNGYSISNLYINRPFTDEVGLFGSLGLTGSVQNVVLTSANITGFIDTGALVGLNAGAITNSSSEGAVTGAIDVGGLVGENDGTISNSFSDTSVVATNSNGGGLVGGIYASSLTPTVIHSVTISNSYSTGDVFSANEPGGLVGGIYSAAIPGFDFRATIENTYSTGTVNGSTAGGLIGFTNPTGTTVTNSYWDTQTSGQSTSAGGTGLTTAQLESGILPNGFDPTIWLDIPGQFPHLLWQVTNPLPSPYWGTFAFPWSQPIPGPHIYPPTLSVNAATGTLELMYGFTPTYAPYTLFRYAVQFDPFFLPLPPLSSLTAGYAFVDASTIFQLPLHQNLVLANTSPNSVEGIAVFQTQDANGNNYIKESFITGENGSLSAGTSTQIAGPLSGTIENTIFEPFRTSAGVLSTYGVAWDQYNPATGAYSISVEIFNHNSGDPNFGSAADFAPTGIVTFSEGTFASETSLPLWTFAAAGGAYVVARTGHFSGLNQDSVQVLGFNTDGSIKSTSFTFRIDPDLSAFPGDTNHITLQSDPASDQLMTGSLRLVQQSSPGNLYGIAWDESITDSGGTVVGNQVEFTIFQPLVGVVHRHTFQTGASPEKVRLQLESNSIFVLVYGDDTATHLVRFDTSGNVLASATDPTDHTFDSIAVLGDGRVAVLYDDNALDPLGLSSTSQIVSHVFDFRTTGVNINDASLVDGNNKYVAGTKFNDAFIGEPNVLNEYYYLGANPSSATLDSFIGGSNGFNVAILPGAMSAYSLTNTFGPLYVSNITGPAPLNSGNLIAANVQELAFNPIVEPAPQSGLIDVTGGGVYLNTPLNSTLSATIAGSILELASPLTSSGQVTFFNFGTATLRLDYPGSFQGTISDLLPGDIIDLVGIDPSTTTALFDGSTLIVHTIAATFQYHITGAAAGNTFKVQTDGVGGTDLIFQLNSSAALLFDNKIDLTRDQIAVELIHFAVDAYPDPNGIGYHKSIPLTPPSGIPPDSYARVDIETYKWHALSASELGLTRPGQQELIKYSFVGGYYQAIQVDPFTGIPSVTLDQDPSEADALALTAVVNDKRTLAISFAGTDQLSDWLDFPNFKAHYDKFAPLVAAIKDFIDANHIEQVFVSGHSLGAAMVQYFLEEFPGDSRFQAWTIGSPGADDVSSAAASDARIINFIHEGDKVTQVPLLSGAPDTIKGAFIPLVADFLLLSDESLSGINGLEEAYSLARAAIFGHDKFREGSDIVVGDLFSGHDAFLYEHHVDSYYGFPLKYKVADGHISSATVFVDANANGVLDPGEISATTDSTGYFAPLDGVSPLIAYGGTDTSTGLKFRGILEAPAGSTAITPLTTLIVVLENQGLLNAQARLLAVFGIDSSMDLTTLDPIAASANNPGAAKVYSVGAEVMNTVTMIASALTNNGTPIAQNTVEVFGALANLVRSHGANTINLADLSFVTQLVTTTAEMLHHPIDPAFVSAVATVVSVSNSALEQSSSQLTGQALIDAVSIVEKLGQGSESAALQGAAGDSSFLSAIVNAFTGSNLTNALTPKSTGADHTPWLATDNAVSHAITEIAGKTGSLAPDTTTGKLLFTDADLSDTHQVSDVLDQSSVKWMNADGTASSTTLPTGTSDALVHAIQAALVSDSTNGNIGEISWSFSAADHYFDFLAAGEALRATYKIAVTDNHGATSVEPVTIVISGTDDNPTAVLDSNGVAKGATLSVATSAGVLANDTDPDVHDHLVVGAVNGSAAGVGHVVKGTYGSLTLNSDGSSVYAANKGALPSQIVAQDTFSYMVSDGHGGTSTSTLSIVVSNPDVIYQSGMNTTLIGTLNGKNVLDGSAGHDVLIGGSDADVLIGGEGDTLTGGSGPDAFVFRPNFGKNVITDFKVNNDAIQFDKSIFSGVTDILNHATNTKVGALIDDGHGDSVILLGVTLSQLQTHQSDFHLV